MSLQTRLEAFAQAIGADIKQLRTDVAASGGSGGPAASPVGVKATALPTATSLDGTEIIYLVQGGISEKAPVSLIRPWSEEIRTTTYVNATVTASDVFVGFVPLANTRYLIDVLVTAQSIAATSGIQTAIVGPTTGITRSSVKVISAATATTDQLNHLALNGFQVALNSLTTPHLISVQAIVEVGATPGAGNLRFQARTEVAATNAVQIFPGSSMRWRVI